MEIDLNEVFDSAKKITKDTTKKIGKMVDKGFDQDIIFGNYHIKVKFGKKKHKKKKDK